MSSYRNQPRASRHPDHRPQTPPEYRSGSQTIPFKGRRPVVRPSFPETFLDDLTPIERHDPGGLDSADGEGEGDEADDDDEGEEEDDDEDKRDPHDLSLNPALGVRSSIVDNMLLSLDQLSAPNTASCDFDDSLPYDSPHQQQESFSNYPLGLSASSNSRYRSHTLSSSISSDVEPYTQKKESRLQLQIQNQSQNLSQPQHRQNQHPHSQRRDHGPDGKGYRRNSNPNKQQQQQPQLQQFTIRHVDGSSEGGERPSYRSKVYDSQRAVCSNDRIVHSRTTPRFVRRESTSSTDSSLDLTEMLATTSIYGARRSASFDYGSTFPSRANRSDPPFGHRDTLMQYDDMNAAPTPTVPAGPRRNRSPPTMADHASNIHTHTPPGSSSRTPALARKNSTKSARSMYSRKPKTDTLGTSTIRGRNDEYNKYLGDVQNDIPPVPSLAQAPAPSPTIARTKQSHLNPFPVENVSTPPPKERQGFFRRVFGSSKQSSPSQSDVSPHTSRDIENSSDPSRNDSTSNNSKMYKESLSNATNATREQPPAVTKKPSSFFRRRKRSIADNAPPPLVLPHSNLGSSESSRADFMKSESLKIGNPTETLRTDSLSKAMKPYLSDMDSPERFYNGNKPHEQQESEESDAESPTRRDYLQSADSKPRSTRKLQRPSRLSNKPLSPPQVAGAAKPSTQSLSTRPTDSNNNSFLADSSGNEGNKLAEDRQLRRPRTSPEAPTQSLYKTTPKPKREAVLATRPNGASSQQQTPAESNSGLLREPAVSPAFPKRDLQQKAASVSPSNVDSGHSRQKQPLHIDTSGRSLFSSENKEKSSPRVSASASTASNYHTAHSTPVHLSSDENLDWGSTPTAQPQSSVETIDDGVASLDENMPSLEDRQVAQKLFDNSDEEVAAGRFSAAWLGTPNRGLLRRAYMDLFDWSDMNILMSLRSLCSKIALKGEAQQVDRVLDAFSSRWCECNPNHGFKATDVVHTICYSLLLLNTDLHLADIEQKMTKPQFIRNTLPTIQRVVAEAAPEAFKAPQLPRTQSKPIIEPERSCLVKPLQLNFEKQHSHSPTSTEKSDELAGSENSAIEAPTVPPPRHPSRASYLEASHAPAPLASPLVSTPFTGTMKAWETQIEAVLKDFYTSIQKQKLPLRGATVDSEESTPSASGFLTLTTNMLRRTPSTISRGGPGEAYRGRGAENRHNTARWSSKPRSRPRLYPPSAMGSSRTSLDDQSSIWSPSGSSTWSKNSLGKTLTSLSVDSLGSDYPRGDYQQSIGFANALSHAIIREDSSHSIAPSEDQSRMAMILEDESLELAGAPWAKEGSLKHKHHLDSIDKRAKDRNWNETFAVIQRGWMRLFSFNSSNKSTRLKPKHRQNGGLVVGGGNWMENADETWKFLLRHTIASALPAPGYSKSRPHVWALSLPTGAVHLFQVGTADIVKEFVSTANYWSARLSKGPLFGAISNIEYGWGDAVINTATIHVDDSKASNTAQATGASGAAPRPSLQSSIRSSLDQQVTRPRLPADRIVLSDWRPPQQSMMASTSSEAEQLETLRSYVKHVEQELQRHNELRGAVILAFSPRHANYSKALHNWERKSSYLLREIVKFRTYIDSLVWAESQREKIYQAADTVAA